MDSDKTPLTRRSFLARSTALATGGAALAATSGCETLSPRSIATRAAARSAPEAVRPLVEDLAAPDHAISTGDAWVAFCDALKPLAGHVTGPAAGDDLQLQTEGMRALGRLVSLGLDRFVEHADPRSPSFYDLQTPSRKYLGDNPDQSYRGAAIEGGGTYRLRGSTEGTAGVEIGVYAGSFRSDADGPGGGRRLVDSLDESSLAIEDDGSWEILVRPDSTPGLSAHNELRLAPDANSILVRTYFWDRDLRVAHTMPTIERLDVEGPRALVTPETLIKGWIATAMFVDGSLGWWNDFQGIQTAPNELIEMPDDGTVQTPSLVRYLNGRVELTSDEALLVDFVPENEPAYWSWVLQNLWGETPDWRDRPIVRNNRDVTREADGRVRLVVAHRDPGHPNWMDMSGHARLVLSLRWRGASALPAVTTRVVPIASLD